MKRIYFKYKALDTATKILIIIDMICFMEILISSVMEYEQLNSTDIVIRSIFTSINGYLLGSTTDYKAKLSNVCIRTTVAGVLGILGLSTLIIIHWIDENISNESISVLTDTLFMTVGYLVSKSRENLKKIEDLGE